MIIIDFGQHHFLGLLVSSKLTSIPKCVAENVEYARAVSLPDLRGSHQSRLGWLTRRRVPLLGICGASLVSLLVFGPLNAMGQSTTVPSASGVARAIEKLALCGTSKFPAGPLRRKCGYQAIAPVSNSENVVQLPDNCATDDSWSKKEIDSVQKCTVWLQEVQQIINPKENSAQKVVASNEKIVKGTFGAFDSTQPVPSVATRNAAAPIKDGASAPAPSASESASLGVGKSNEMPKTQNAVNSQPREEASSTDILSQTVLISLLGAFVIAVVAIAILYFRLRGGNAELEDRLQRRDEEIKKLKAQNTQVNDELARARRDRVNLNPSAALADHASRSVTPVVTTPPPEPRVTVARRPPTVERPMITSQAVEDVILKAIHALAHERVSLTEANFVAKVAGFASDPSLKAALEERLVPARFYLCSGVRSAQGPELLAYLLRGQTTCSVVPFPTAGRVGQFIRWFENAGSAYDVDPVLAARPARGVFNEAGSLSVSQPGLLA